MSVRWALIGGSLLLHGGGVLALGWLHARESHAATSIEVTETAKPTPPPQPAKVEPPQPPSEAPRKQRAAKAAEPKPLDAAPKPEAGPPKLADLPDLGELGSGGSGAGVPVPPPATTTAPAPRATGPITKTLQAAPPPKDPDACTEPAGKPKLVRLPQPAYTEAARAAGVEGKVRVELTVDETGKVVAVRALSTLGHGLDQAALAAARQASFQPATRCGKPTRATFTISIRFSAS